MRILGSCCLKLWEGPAARGIRCWVRTRQLTHSDSFDAPSANTAPRRRVRCCWSRLYSDPSCLAVSVSSTIVKTALGGDHYRIPRSRLLEQRLGVRLKTCEGNFRL